MIQREDRPQGDTIYMRRDLELETSITLLEDTIIRMTIAKVISIIQDTETILKDKFSITRIIKAQLVTGHQNISSLTIKGSRGITIL